MTLLADLLGRSSAAHRVLSLLVSMPGQELHTRAIARRVEADPHSVQLALNHLLETGAVRSRRIGNLRLWSIDPTSDRVGSVRDLLRREGAVAELLAGGLSEMPGVRLALIFGSFASGADVPGSDIDVLLVGVIDWKRLAHLGESVAAHVGREVSFVVWTEAELERPTSGQRRLLASVLSRPRMFLKGSESEFISAGDRVATTVLSVRDADSKQRRARSAKVERSDDTPRSRKRLAAATGVRPRARKR